MVVDWANSRQFLAIADFIELTLKSSQCHAAGQRTWISSLRGRRYIVFRIVLFYDFDLLCVKCRSIGRWYRANFSSIQFRLPSVFSSSTYYETRELMLLKGKLSHLLSASPIVHEEEGNTRVKRE